MSEGKMMYQDIVDDTGPFSAAVYWLLFLLFGKSLVAHKILAIIFLFIQVVTINYLFNNYKSFEENTYVPAFTVMVLANASFDFLILSPILMGSTFLVLALGQLFSHTVLQKEGNDTVLLMGILAGIGFCFHFSLIFFLPYMLLMGIIISGFSFKQLLLSTAGFFLPLLICCTYYFWQDGLQDFLTKFLVESRNQEIYTHVRLRDILILLSVPILFSFLGVIFGAVIKSLTVNQQKQLQLMLFYFIFGVASILLTNNRAPFHFVILIVPFAYFISMLLLSFRKKQLANSMGMSFLVMVLLVGYTWILVKIIKQDLAEYAVKVEPRHQVAQGKTVWVLGKDLAFYKEGKQETPYLNYYLSKEFLSDPSRSQIVNAYRNIYLSLPEIIVDEEGVFEELLENIPNLNNLYRKEGLYYFLISED